MSFSVFDMIQEEMTKGPSISIGGEAINVPSSPAGVPSFVPTSPSMGESPQSGEVPRAVPSTSSIQAAKPPPPLKKEPTSVKKEVEQAPNDFASAYSPFDVVQKEMEGKIPEGWWEATARNITRTGSRMVETVLGLPGDIVQFADFVGSSLPQVPSWMQQEPNFLQKSGNYLLNQLPTQQSLQKQSESLTGGYTAPQGSGEEVSDEIFKTLANLLSGTEAKQIVQGATSLGGAARQGKKLGRMLGQAIGAESAKEGVKLYKGGEGLQEAAKLGSLFVMGLTLPRLTGEVNPDRYLNSLYRERDALIPQGTMVTPSGLQSDLQAFIDQQLRRGGPTPEKTQVAGIAQQFLDRLAQGPVEMDELIEMYRSVNRNRANVMAAPDLDKAGVRAARGYWGRMAHMFNGTIEGYLGGISPEALRLHRSANSGWASMAQSKSASNFIMNKLKGVPLHTGVAALFGGGIFNPMGALQVVGGAAGAAGLGTMAVKSMEMAYRFLTNPTLRHYYNQVLINAIRENAPATVHAVQKLDKSYQKELKDPESTVNRPVPKFPQPSQTKTKTLQPGKIDRSSLVYPQY